jgi:hypothetical protein
LLYVERWLKAPMQTTDGQILERSKGTPASKHKGLAGHKTPAAERLRRLANGQPDAFVRWSLGFLP